MLSRWRLSKNFTQVFNNKCESRKPPTIENYEKIFEDGESSKSKLGVWFQLGCGFEKVGPPAPHVTAARLLARDSVRSDSFSFNCRLEDPKNPWTPSSKVQTIHINHTASKHSKKVSDTEQKSKNCARKANCDRPEPWRRELAKKKVEPHPAPVLLSEVMWRSWAF